MIHRLLCNDYPMSKSVFSDKRGDNYVNSDKLNANARNLGKAAERWHQNVTPKILAHYGDVTGNFLKKCICPTNKRMTVQDALDHPWVFHI